MLASVPDANCYIFTVQLGKKEVTCCAVDVALELSHGIVTATANGKRVTLVTAERRNFDAIALAQLVSASVFAQVTKTTVDVKLFDLAREADAISEVTEVAVTRNTPYTAIKITNANEVAIAQVA
jgi:hypothetical protein